MLPALATTLRAEAERFVRSIDADPEWIERNWDNLFGQALDLITQSQRIRAAAPAEAA